MPFVQELRLDVEELQRLLEMARRPKTRNMLNSEIQKLQAEIIKEEARTDSCSSVEAKAAPSKPASRYTKEILTYAWDQSDKFLKLYISEGMTGVGSLPKEAVVSKFTSRSCYIKVSNADKKDYVCEVKNLFGEIVPSDCYHKVKTDSVVLMLRKIGSDTWAHVTSTDKKEKKTPKPDENKDPQEGIMDLLKQMYEDGDDEMKRSIAKAWSESRDKKMPGMDV